MSHTEFKKRPFGIDVPVLLIFFNRPNCFAKVFEHVKLARPSKLFLYQDGARDGNAKDIACVSQCREIASDIDWECEVHTLYQDKNIGCDPSGYFARKWAFEQVDRCIILEDDCVPNQSCFRFFKEMLDRYADDQRINMVCGMNNMETWDSPYSYLFTESGSIWGVATWRRVFQEWDPQYSLLSDNYNRNKLIAYMQSSNVDYSGRWNTWDADQKSGVEHHEALGGMVQFAGHRLNIVPTKNMITNVGNTPEGSTHSMSSLDVIPKGLRRIYTMKSYEIDFPLKHPKYIINDVEFQKQLFRVMGWGHPMVQFWRRIEKVFLMIKHEGVAAMIKKTKSALSR